MQSQTEDPIFDVEKKVKRAVFDFNPISAIFVHLLVVRVLAGVVCKNRSRSACP
jgi:hypothetical protein